MELLGQGHMREAAPTGLKNFGFCYSWFDVPFSNLSLLSLMALKDISSNYCCTQILMGSFSILYTFFIIHLLLFY